MQFIYIYIYKGHIYIYIYSLHHIPPDVKKKNVYALLPGTLISEFCNSSSLVPFKVMSHLILS